MMRRSFLKIAALFLTLVCAPVAAEAKVVHVVASFTILADLVRQIGGDKVEVRSLVGPNGDPHTFEPTPSDAQSLLKADLVVVNGLGLEGWMDRLILASGYRGQPIVASKGVPALKFDEDGRSVLDPHAWNDVAHTIAYVRTIADGLMAADPEDRTALTARRDAYIRTLAALDVDVRREIDGVPAERRKILTTHDALGYFAKAYGVQILSPLGISTEQEPSASAMAALIGQIKREHVTTYFLENSNDPRLISQIAAATGARPGGDLYVESLSPPGGPADTYVAMFRHNLDLIIKAMHGAV